MVVLASKCWQILTMEGMYRVLQNAKNGRLAQGIFIQERQKVGYGHLQRIY